MIRTCRRLLSFVRRRPNHEALNRFLRRNFRVYRAVGNDGRGRVLFTGYFEPRLKGSLKRGNRYRYPVYARPDDLIKVDLGRFSERLAGERIFGRLEGRRLIPYFSRDEIDGQGRLVGRCPVLAWVQDPVALFFLQIQGSGRIYLDDGSTINVHYDASNGRPYRSIGKLLLERGEIAAEEMSMQRIRQYLQDHPQEMDSVLNHNESYVFFRLEAGGPYGSLGVPVTPGRTIATDRRLFPPGAPAFIHTTIPEIDGAGRIHRWRSSRRLVLNQDTGGAIRGPGRADLFWGGGQYAELAAGHQRHPGSLYFLALKPEASAGNVRHFPRVSAAAGGTVPGLTPTGKTSTSLDPADAALCIAAGIQPDAGREAESEPSIKSRPAGWRP
jgi:membrane-bound lytic murein transglycosylase A